MSSNFLSLNPSKTEFLIFGLPQQLSKLNNSTIHLPNNVILSPVDSTRHLDTAVRYHISSQLNSLKLVQIISRRSMPSISNRFHFIFAISHVQRVAAWLSPRPSAVCAVHRWTNATHWEPRLRLHLYTDDAQICEFYARNESQSLQIRLSACIIHVSGWMRPNCLQWNAANTKIIWSTTNRRLLHLPQSLLCVGQT